MIYVISTNTFTQKTVSGITGADSISKEPVIGR